MLRQLPELELPNEFRYFGTTGRIFCSTATATEYSAIKSTDTDSERGLPYEIFGRLEFFASTYNIFKRKL